MQEHASSEPTNTDVDETARTEEDVGRLLYAIANADQKSWPYRHFAVRDVIDSAWAKELASMDLGERMVRIAEQRRIRVDPNRFTLTLMPGDPGDLPAPIARLRAMFAAPAVAHTLVDVFRDVLRHRLNKSGGEYRLRRSLDLMEDRTGYRLTPHTDHRAKLVTMILYLDDEPEGVPLGTSVYVPKRPMDGAQERFMGPPWHYDREDFTRVATVPHRAGSAFCFAPVPNSFHGVEPVEHPDARRFLVQFQVLALDEADLIR
ncbi:hypothetical protein BAL199_30197 [alpha proteobacterium BAL199]|jgi:hypothetical protein|nr:hypothetical protein BAL199_30197 [alpha proteobacterium BAL199]